MPCGGIPTLEGVLLIIAHSSAGRSAGCLAKRGWLIGQNPTGRPRRTPSSRGGLTP